MSEKNIDSTSMRVHAHGANPAVEEKNEGLKAERLKTQLKRREMRVEILNFQPSVLQPFSFFIKGGWRGGPWAAGLLAPSVGARLWGARAKVQYRSL
jgi:hypothetical protein